MTDYNSHFSMHGVDILFSSDSLDIASPVEHHMKPFSGNISKEKGSLQIVFQSVRSQEDIPERISPSVHALFSRSGSIQGSILWKDCPYDVYRDRSRLIAIFHGQGLVVIEAGLGLAQGYLIKPEDMPADVRRNIFRFALTELLKSRGLYSVHAAALEKNGHGILIPGISGQGKTTTFLSLLRGGYRALSDDHPFLQANGKGVEVLPFPTAVNVTEQTIKFFPELFGVTTLLSYRFPKRFFYVDDLYFGRNGKSCPARILLFPHVVDSPTSRLESLSKSQALVDLLPHGLLVYAPEVAKQEFQALSLLVQQVECYRLHFGRDVLHLPRLIDPLFDRN